MLLRALLGEAEHLGREVEGEGVPDAAGQPPRELGVDQKVHAPKGSMRFTRLRRAANASAARMSSRSRSS